jgi:hypothetical protein
MVFAAYEASRPIVASDKAVDFSGADFINLETHGQEPLARHRRLLADQEVQLVQSPADFAPSNNGSAAPPQVSFADAGANLPSRRASSFSQLHGAGHRDLRHVRFSQKTRKRARGHKAVVKAHAMQRRVMSLFRRGGRVAPAYVRGGFGLKGSARARARQHHLAMFHRGGHVAPAYVRGGFGLKGTARARALKHQLSRRSHRSLHRHHVGRDVIARRMAHVASFGKRHRKMSVAVQPKSFTVDRRWAHRHAVHLP